MGDGKTALILDAEGLARFGGVKPGKEKIEPPSILSQIRETIVKTEGLVLKAGSEYYFLPIGAARKLVPVKTGKIETIGENQYFWVEGSRHHYYQLNPTSISCEKSLGILLRNTIEPTAISVDECIDSVAIPSKIEPLENGARWVKGTLPWNGKILRVLDVSQILPGQPI